MHLRHVAADIAVLLVVCVAAMFLHPVVHGPYSAVHGPTTAFRALYKYWLTLSTIGLAASRMAARITMVRASTAVTSFACAAVLLFYGGEPPPLRC